MTTNMTLNSLSFLRNSLIVKYINPSLNGRMMISDLIDFTYHAYPATHLHTHPYTNTYECTPPTPPTPPTVASSTNQQQQKEQQHCAHYPKY